MVASLDRPHTMIEQSRWKGIGKNTFNHKEKKNCWVDQYHSPGCNLNCVKTTKRNKQKKTINKIN